MKKCPFCGADIEDSARFCLYCMQSLTEKEQVQLHKKKKPQWLLIIAAIVAAIVMLSITLAIILPGKQAALNHGVSVDSTTASNQTEPSDPLHIHSYCVENTESEYLKELATCTSPAVFYYSCVCGEKGSETFFYGATADHTIVKDVGYPATCVSTGLTDGAHCSICNAVLLTQTQLPVANHTYDNDRDERCNVCNYVRVLVCDHAKTDVLSAVSPTCTAGGLTEGRKCSLCEEILAAQMTLAPLGHTEVIDEAIAATCTADGRTEGKHCATCNTVLVAQITIAAKGHTEVMDPAVAATCTTDGLTEGKHCATCKTVLVAQTAVTAKGHTEVTDSAVAATCTTNGLTEGKHCATCNTVLVAQTTVTAKGHTEVMDPAVAATCTTNGLTEGKHCTTCNTVLVAQTTVTAKGHTEVIDPAVAATCTTEGKTEGSHCSVCQVVFVYQQPIGALGHSFDSENPAEPCSSCGTLPHIHSFTEENTDAKYLKSPANCTSANIYYYSCVCGETGSRVFSSGTYIGHNVIVEPGYPPGCVTEGLTDRVYCSVCNEGFEYHATIPATGHAFSVGSSHSVCLDCGEYATLTINAPKLPCVVNSFGFKKPFRIDRITYSLKPITGGYFYIEFTFYGTNISSEPALFNFSASLHGPNNTALGSSLSRYLNPNESGTFLAAAQIVDASGTYTLIFD